MFTKELRSQLIVKGRDQDAYLAVELYLHANYVWDMVSDVHGFVRLEHL